MKSQQRILIIDDEVNMRHMLTAMLTRLNYQVSEAEDGHDALELMEQQAFGFVLCDIKMPNMDGMAFLKRAKERFPEITVIMMSAFGSVEKAVEAMRLGAYDYISKPFKADEIELTLKKAVEREALRQDNQHLRAQLASMEGEYQFGKMIGRSKVMQEIFSLASKVAPFDTTVLITGASGTGKELVARGIHNASSRAGEKFVAVNCGAFPESLIESELFGYVRGAFTGADKNKKGVFQEADKGTLFLDEIGELTLPLQVKLLRVLQEREVQAVGSCTNQKVDVRIVAATAKDLEQEVAAGRFREDLFYRLHVLHIKLPALRERREDIPLLSNFFLRRYATQLNRSILEISSAAMTKLLNYNWPGNVRQLENTIERAVVLADKQIILPENLPEEFGNPNRERRIDDLLGGFSVKKAQKIMEKKLISRALQVTGNNKTKASELLEMSYPSLLNKIKEYKLPQY